MLSDSKAPLKNSWIKKGNEIFFLVAQFCYFINKIDLFNQEPKKKKNKQTKNRKTKETNKRINEKNSECTIQKYC